MADISHWEFSIKEILTDIRRRLEIAKDKKSSKEERTKAVDGVSKLFMRLASLRKSYRTEMNLIGQSSEKVAAKRQLDKFKEEESSLKGEFEWLKAAVQKEELVHSAEVDIEGVSGDDIMREALNIQGEDISRLKRLDGVINETKQMGLATNEMLTQQTEQLQNINVKTLGIKSDISRANQLLTVYKRRIMTDRMIWVFIFLVFAGIVTIIIYSTLNPDQKMFNVYEK